MAKQKAAQNIAKPKPQKLPPIPTTQPSPTEVKSWAMRYEDIPTAEAAERRPLAALLSRSPELAEAWERGQFLRHLKIYGGDTNLTLAEVEIEMGLPAGSLEAKLATDIEAAECFNNARRATRIAILKIYIDRARTGELTPPVAKQLAEMLKKEVAKTTFDIEHIPTAMMAELFGVTRLTLLNWQKEAAAPVNPDKRTYNLRSFIPWYKKFIENKIARQPGRYGIDIDSETKRLRARKIQVQIDELERRLVPAERVVAGLLARAAALDKYIAANGESLYLRLAGKTESQVAELLSQYNSGLRRASSQLPADWADLLPPEVANDLAALLGKLKPKENNETKGPKDE